jgi:hypothetical protein
MRLMTWRRLGALIAACGLVLLPTVAEAAYRDLDVSGEKFKAICGSSPRCTYGGNTEGLDYYAVCDKDGKNCVTVICGDETCVENDHQDREGIAQRLEDVIGGAPLSLTSNSSDGGGNAPGGGGGGGGSGGGKGDHAAGPGGGPGVIAEDPLPPK